MTNPRGKLQTAFRRYRAPLLNALLFNGWAAALSYRCGLHGRLGVTRHRVTLPAARALPRPLRIAFASDFHAGPTTDPALFDALFDCLAQERPDVLLLGGDFISGKAENLAALSAGLARCEPPLGKFGVYGNHDLWADDELMGRMLADAGVRMLVNRHVTLPAPFDAVSICGLDDPWAGAPDAGAAFAGAADVRVLLMHAPDGLLLLGGERFDLAFAGHTHGGQVAFRDGKPLILPQGPLGRSHYHGRYDTAGDGPLIVSRGIGCSTIPLRINADPELVICTIE